MKRLVLALLLCLVLSFPVLAQEPTTPPADVVILNSQGASLQEESGAVTTGDDSTVVVNEDNSDPLAPLMALAGTVFATLELIKTGFLSGLATAGGWKDKPVYSFVIWGLASILAFILLLGSPEGLDIFTITGWTLPFGTLFSQIVTALAIGAGSGLLNALYSYLRAPKELATVTRTGG